MNKSFRKAFLLIFLICPLMLFAQQVSVESAKQKALTFLTKSDKSSTTRSVSNKIPRLVLTNNRDEFYVFNDEANGGYVIVSGDERMPDVLGYSYLGHFDPETIPCNMRAWLEDYANQVIYLRSHPEVHASRRTTSERKEISPLLKCHFNQDKYYNDKCPLVDGEPAVTGCVATAMAQIMYYYQWPKQTTDTIPCYTSSTRNIDMPAIPVMTIDWDNILEQYNSWEDYSDKQIDAISSLMLLCGTSVKMDYATEHGSEASVSNADIALRSFFDYDDFTVYLKRENVELDIWIQMLYDEMNSGRPVLYSGSTWKGIELIGHAFVLDGYKDGYFHLNWGWGGSSDDYFLLTDLNGYDGNQNALVGIHPNNDDYPSRYAVLDNDRLTLYYDKEKSHRLGTILSRRGDWIYTHASECVIDPSFAKLEALSFANLFEQMRNLKSIQGLEYLNTSKVLDMRYMFRDCSSLMSLDLGSFKTDNVMDMRHMFRGCSSLTSLDLSGFKTDNVRDMRHMFRGCSSLTSLDLSNFNTNRVSNMAPMFYCCSNLRNLDLSSFNTYSVTDMEYMFSNCSNLTTIYASEHWNMLKVEKADNIFDACNCLIGGAGTTYNSQHIKDDYAHIDGGSENPGYFTYKGSKFHTITYLVGDQVYMIQTYNYGDHITPAFPPYREGYFFYGWSDLPETMPDSDIIIYATFTSGFKDMLKEKHPLKVFSVNGREQDKIQKGFNIIRYSDGSIKKVLVK